MYTNLFRWRNKLIYILDGLRVRTFSANLNFWVNCSFKLPFKFSFEWRTTLKWSFVRSWQAYIKLSEKTDNLTGKWTLRKTEQWTETARVWWSYSLSSRWLGRKLSGGVYTSTTISFPPWLAPSSLYKTTRPGHFFQVSAPLLLSA